MAESSFKFYGTGPAVTIAHTSDLVALVEEENCKGRLVKYSKQNLREIANFNKN